MKLKLWHKDTVLGRCLCHLGVYVTFTVRMRRLVKVCHDDADKIQRKCLTKEGCKSYQEGLNLQ